MAVIVGVVGWTVVKPDKLVRIIFPYIRRSGDSTVVFGHILQENHVKKLFWFVLLIVFSTTWIVFTNILIQYSGNDNPYAGSSIKLQCFLKHNDCFAINLNFAAALGQAASALAFAWLIMATLTWAKLNWDEIKNGLRLVEFKFCCSMAIKIFCSKTIMCGAIVVVFAIVTSVITALTIISYCGYTYFATFVQILLICLILLSTLVIFCDKNIKKKPKTLKDYFKEKFTEPPNNRIKRTLINEMAKLEFKRFLAHAGYNIESDEEMIQTAYDEINQLYTEPDEQEQDTEPATDDLPNETTNHRTGARFPRMCFLPCCCYKAKTIAETMSHA